MGCCLRSTSQVSTEQLKKREYSTTKNKLKTIFQRSTISQKKNILLSVLEQIFSTHLQNKNNIFSYKNISFFGHFPEATTMNEKNLIPIQIVINYAPLYNYRFSYLKFISVSHSEWNQTFEHRPK